MRITLPPAVGLIATHAALVTDVHGVTGTVCGLSDTQTLTNKTIGAGGLTFTNVGAGTDPILESNAAGQYLMVTGGLSVTVDFASKSSTAFYSTFQHTCSASRAWTFPDVDGNVLVDADTTKQPTFTRVTILNVGAGANPVLRADAADQRLSMTGVIDITGHFITAQDFIFRSGTAFEARLQHTLSAGRDYTFPDVDGTVCMWGAGNVAVTRYYTMSGAGLFGKGHGDTGTWSLAGGLDLALHLTNESGSFFCGVNLPHGAIVTAFRVGCQLGNAGDNAQIYLYQKPRLSNGINIMAQCDATTTEEEISDTSISSATINNDTGSYLIRFQKAGTDGDFDCYDIQIDYTVTEPYP